MNSRERWRLLDARMDRAGEKIDAGQEGRRAVALVLVVARVGRMDAGLGRKVRCGLPDRLDAGLLVVGDDGDRPVGLACGGFHQDLDLLVDTQDLGHPGVEVHIAALEVVADLVRLHRMGVEDLADGALSEPVVPTGGPVLTRMARQKPRRPQLVWIAEVFGLAAGERHEPGFRLGRDRRSLPQSRAVIERR